MVRASVYRARRCAGGLCAMSMAWGGSASSWSCTPPRTPSRRSSPRPGVWASGWASTSTLSWRRTAARSSIVPGTGRRDSWVIDFYDPDGAADVIAAGAAADPDAPVRAVLPVGGEGPARVAALAARADRSRRAGSRCGGRRRQQAADARDLRGGARAVAGGAALPGGAHRRARRPTSPARVAVGVGWPCVLKPLLLSASRGVMRADDPRDLRRSGSRGCAACCCAPALLEMDPIASRQILVEEYIPGPEVALEGLLVRRHAPPAGALRQAGSAGGSVLRGDDLRDAVAAARRRRRRRSPAASRGARARSASAAGRCTRSCAWTSGGARGDRDLAARPIGGLCSRTLRFGATCRSRS